MVDKKGDNKVYLKEFLEMAKGECINTVGLAFPPSIPLLEKKNTQFGNMINGQYKELSEN